MEPSTPDAVQDRNRVLAGAVPFVLAAGAAAKCLVFALQAGGASRPVLLLTLTASVALALTSWTCLLVRRLRMVLLLCADAALTVALIADAAFFRYYGNLIPFPAFTSAGQAAGVQDSVKALLRPSDALYALTLPLLAWLLVRAGRGSKDGTAGMWTGKAVAAVTAGALAAAAGTVYLIEQRAPGAVDNRYANQALARAAGPLGYHAVDAARSLTGGATSNVTTEEAVIEARARERAAGHDLKGAAAGSNVIVVQLEATMNMLIGKKVNGVEITPTLNRLARSEAIYFDDFYSTVGAGNTSDAEFIALNSLYPLAAESAYNAGAGADHASLPETLRANGYQRAVAFHGYDDTFYSRTRVYPRMGFDEFVNDDVLDLSDKIGLGLSDQSFYAQAAPRIAALPEPSLSFLITLSGHHPYQIPAAAHALDTTGYGKVFGDYLQSQAYTDRQLGAFLEGLDRTGKLDTSTVVVYGDHWGTGWDDADVSKFRGTLTSADRQSQLQMRAVPLLIRLPNTQHAQTVSGTAEMADVYPTLLNLLGIPRDSVYTLGRDLLNTTGGQASFRYYEPQGTFVSDDLMFLADPEGVWAAGTCIDRTTSAPTGRDRCKKGHDEALRRLRLSDDLLAGKALGKIDRRLAETVETAPRP